MLSIYENGMTELPLNVRAPVWYIEHRYEGNDILKFEIPDTHDAYSHLAEEARISNRRATEAYLAAMLRDIAIKQARWAEQINRVVHGRG